MSDYDFRPGGSLKIKGGLDGGIKKKKKSKSKGDKGVKNDSVIHDSEAPETVSLGEGRDDSPVASGSSEDRKTAAEKRFQQVQRKRLADKVKRLATTTHKDRVHEFNSKLEALSEHHDIPKVGPG